MGKPRDDKDTAQDLARDLAEIATHIGQLKGEAYAYLTSPSYDRLKLGLECALSAVEAAPIEARRRVRLNEERKRRGRVPGGENFQRGISERTGMGGPPRWMGSLTDADELAMNWAHSPGRGGVGPPRDVAPALPPLYSVTAF